MLKTLMKFIAMVACAATLGAHAAAPVINCTPSRTSGTAPLGVTWDCTATTDADTTKPFRELLYAWNFGDSGAGKWNAGSNTAASKNAGWGAVVGHVYETAGTYTWRLQVSDGTSTVSTSGTITVADPDSTFSGANTYCFYNSTVGSGCPAGATQTQSSDFDAALASCIGTTRRCLFQRGGTFTSSTTGTVASAGPNTIGAYGSGALPIIDCTSTTCSGGVVNINNVAVNDLRVMDLDIFGKGVADTGNGIVYAANVTNVTILRVTIRNIGKGITGSGVAECTGCVVQESTIYDIYAASGGNAFLGRLITSALIGNTMGPSFGEHVMRPQKIQKSTISNNIITTPAATKCPLTVRADTHATNADDSFFFIVSDNAISSGDVAICVLGLGPNASGIDARLYDWVIERNYLRLGGYTGGSSTSTMSLSARSGSVRNNIMDLTGPPAAGRSGAVVTFDGVEVPDDVHVFNNTCYASDVGVAVLRCVWIQTGCTNSQVKNNIAWFDLGAGSPVTVLDQGTGTVGASGTFGNGSNAQTTGTDPLFAAPASGPQGFRIGTSSYAATSGVALFPSSNDDFYHCDDLTANEHSGALISRTRARCKGVAGPVADLFDALTNTLQASNDDYYDELMLRKVVGGQ